MTSLAATTRPDRRIADFYQRIRQDCPSVPLRIDEESVTAAAADRWPEARKWTSAERDAHLPAAVLSPGDTAEVAAILRAANHTEVPVVPYGAGSGVVGGVVNTAGFVSLDLSRLTDGPHIDDARGEVTLGAGTIAGRLEEALRNRGRRLPHYPQSLHLASVGGLVATRSSGTFSSKYGNIENFVVALEVVLPDGSIIHTRPSPRSSTGPNLTQLFIGSEGTLGVITAVTLRTLPVAGTTRFRGVAFEDLDTGITAVRALLDAGITPAVARLYDPVEAAGLFRQSHLTGGGRSLLVLGFDGHPTVVDAEQTAALECLTDEGGTDLGASPGEIWSEHRYDAGWLESGNADDVQFADAIEISAAWPDLPGLFPAVLDAMRPQVNTVYGHLSHFYSNGAAVYFIFFVTGPDTATALRRYRAAWDAALQVVHDRGGSISHHHGIGEARKNWMAREHGECLRVLAAIKQAIDPNNLLSPGKLGLDATERTAR